jgi:hypothetical protein
MHEVDLPVWGREKSRKFVKADETNLFLCRCSATRTFCNPLLSTRGRSRSKASSYFVCEVSIRHIGDSQEGAIDAYLSTFVDLYIAASAQCVSMGVGNFAYLASRISGTTCRVSHGLVSKSLANAWGTRYKKKYIAECPGPYDDTRLAKHD